MATRPIENTLKGILLLALFISPLIYAPSLYFPYTSGKAYFFRLLVELALIFWVILLFKKPESRPKFKNLLIIALLIFVLALIITAFTGVDSRRSFFSDIERSDGVIQYIHWVLYFLMAISVFRTKKDWQIVLSLFTLTALINCLYGFIRHYHYGEQPQLFGLLGNSSYLGGFLIFAIGFCFLFLLKTFNPFKVKRPKWFIALMAVLILIFAVALTLTQTRGAYFGIFLGFVIFVILANFYLWDKSLPDWKTGRKIIITLNAILFVVLAFLVLIFVFQDSQFVKSQPLINRIANVSHTTSVQDRLAEWKAALKGFKDRPIFGWGPENFDVVANKHYDYRVGLYEPWFDRPHNQALQYLAEGGVVLFSAYLFLVAMVLRSIFKIYRKEKALGSLLLAVYVAYIVQSLILFDTLPVFLGLFVLLGFIYFKTNEDSIFIPNNHNHQINKNSAIFFSTLIISTIFIVFFEIQSVFIPIYGNRFLIDSAKAFEFKDYKGQQILVDKLFSFQSPYLYPSIRRMVGWDFGGKVLDKDISLEDREVVLNLYNKIIPELENWLEYRPVDQQAYYVLGTSYRFGFEKLGLQDALAKAETVFKKALNYSATRIEYIDELGQVLTLEKKFNELDALMKNFASQIDPKDPYRYLSLGHSYFMQGKYDLAMEEYEKARSLGQQFWANDRDYYRYLQAAQQSKDWQKVASVSEEYLKNRGEDATILYNLAVAYYYLGDKAKTKEYFEKAVVLDPNFEQERAKLEEAGAF